MVSEEGPGPIRAMVGAVINWVVTAVLIGLLTACCGGFFAIRSMMPDEPTVEYPPPSPGVNRGPVFEYSNCAQVVADHKAPIKIGDPGWNPDLDFDHDGVACDA